jgi:hypothetical protein
VNRMVVSVRLQPGAVERAKELVASGPPFDPAQHGFERHAVYFAADEAIFFFEGPEVEWRVDEIVEAFPELEAFEAWRPLLDGPPRIAREAYFWTRD